MKKSFAVVAVLIPLLYFPLLAQTEDVGSCKVGAFLDKKTLEFAGEAAPSHLGFDRNEYPGDDNLKELHKTFAFTGFWLNNPPGSKTNTWAGKRGKIEAAGFGFLVLFNGRLYRELKANAAALGKSDADAAIAAAQREGFPARTIIFLDQEQGGRLLAEQKAYLFAWIDEVSKAGFRAGVYCSGIAAEEQSGANIVTAEDIKEHAGSRNITYWVTNDACPRSPGCVVNARPPSPNSSGVDFADVWQFAQSPRRKNVTGGCSGYDKTGSCFPSAAAVRQNLDVDLDTASFADPSHGRTRER
jgi:glycoside hydrolase-like protein